MSIPNDKPIFQNIQGTSVTSYRIGISGPTIYTGGDDPNVTPPTLLDDGLHDGDLYIRSGVGTPQLWIYKSPDWLHIPAGDNITGFSVIGNEILRSDTPGYESLLGDPNDIPNLQYIEDNYPKTTGTTFTGDVELSSPAQLILPDGTIADPALYFGSTASSGLIYGGGDEITVVASGIEVLNIGTQGALGVDGFISAAANSQFLAASSPETKPGFSFVSDPDTGIFSNSPDILGFATNGQQRLTIDASGLIETNVPNYETLISSDDHIVNKKYVDDEIFAQLAVVSLLDLDDVDYPISNPPNLRDVIAYNDVSSQWENVALTSEYITNIPFPFPTYLQNIVEDTSPQLGQTLDMQSFNIESAGNLTINPNSRRISLGGDGAITDHTVNGGTLSDRLLLTRGGATTSILTTKRATDTGNTGPDWLVLRSRGVPATPTVVQDGDDLVEILGAGYDGTDYASGGKLLLSVDGTPGNDDMPATWSFWTSPDGSEDPVERFRVESDGTLSVLGTYTPLITDANDIPNKEYVDSVAAGLDPKESVKAATVSNPGGTYASGGGSGGTGEFTNIDLTAAPFDGVTLGVGDRVLIKDSAGTQNGIYVVTTAGALGVIERATDHDGSPTNEVSAGNFTFVEQGATNTNTGWVLSGNGVLDLNVDPILWVQFTGLGSITTGIGLAQSGSDIFFDPDDLSNTAISTSDEIVFHDIGFVDTANDKGARKRTVSSFITDLNLLTGTAGGSLTASDGVLINASDDIQLDITSLSSIAVVSGDELAFHDASSPGTHIKRTVSSFITDLNLLTGTTGGSLTASDGVLINASDDIQLDIQNLSADTITTSDEIAFHDITSVGTHKKTTISNFISDLNVLTGSGGGGSLTASDGVLINGSNDIQLDINSLSNLAMASADEIVFHDLSAPGTHAKRTVSSFITDLNILTGSTGGSLTASDGVLINGADDIQLDLTTLDGTTTALGTDEIVFHDTSVPGTHRKRTLNNIISDMGIVTSAGSGTLSASDGVLLSGSNNIELDIASLSTVSVLGSDEIAFHDASVPGTHIKRTVSSFISDMGILTGGGGGSLTASDGVRIITNDIQLDIENLVNTAITTSDELVFHDVTASGTHVKRPVSSFLTDINILTGTSGGALTASDGVLINASDDIQLDIQNLLTGPVVSSDELAFHDASSPGSHIKRTVSSFITDLNLLTGTTGGSLTASDGVLINASDDIQLDIQNLSNVAITTADQLAFHDDSAPGTHIKRTVSSFITDANILTGTGGGALTASDGVLINASDDIQLNITGLGTVAAVGSDEIVFHDVSASGTHSKRTFTSIITDLNILTGTTGGSLSASDGVLINGSDDIQLDITSLSSVAVTTADEMVFHDVTNPGTHIKRTAASFISDTGILLNVVEDTSPQLSGNLDIQANNITTSTVNGDIRLVPNGVGVISFPATTDIGKSGERAGTVYATTFDGTATAARYADLAERYTVEPNSAPLEYGTVVVISNSEEYDICACDKDADRKVIGVVSENPGFMMNADAGTDVEAPYIALRGRVMVKVCGKVSKGDSLVTSQENGRARSVTEEEWWANNGITNGTVFAKALSSDKDGYCEAIIL